MNDEVSKHKNMTNQQEEFKMLTRWDPFREMVSMRRSMDRLIDQSFTGQENWNQPDWALALDVVEHENEYVVKASLPGVKAEDVDVTFDKGMLTIRGEVKDESEKEEGHYHMRERRWGVFTRSLSLPSSVNASGIQATFTDGVLTLELPKSEEVKPKKINILQNQKTVEAKPVESKQSSKN